MKADQGCLAYAGLAPDLFATDGAGFGAFRKALWSENRFAPEAFQNRQNFFGGKWYAVSASGAANTKAPPAGGGTSTSTTTTGTTCGIYGCP